MSEQEEAFVIPKPIKWIVPDDLVSQYATNLVIQHTAHEFSISFFELRRPVILGSPEEQRALVERIDSIPAICVARIIVSPERMEQFINAMQENLQRYRERTDL